MKRRMDGRTAAGAPGLSTEEPPRAQVLERGLPGQRGGSSLTIRLVGLPRREGGIRHECRHPVDFLDCLPGFREPGGMSDRCHNPSGMREVESGDVFAEVDRDSLAER